MPLGDGLFSHPCWGSIVSAGTFHFRVRNGNGWIYPALVTQGPHKDFTKELVNVKFRFLIYYILTKNQHHLLDNITNNSDVLWLG